METPCWSELRTADRVFAIFQELININGSTLAFLLILHVTNVRKRVRSAVQESENVLILRDSRESRLSLHSGLMLCHLRHGETETQHLKV